MRIALICLLLACIPAKAQTGYETLDADCDEKTKRCSVSEDQLVRLANANLQMDQAMRQLAWMLRAATSALQEKQEELARLKESCVAKLEIVPDGTRKRS